MARHRKRPFSILARLSGPGPEIGIFLGGTALGCFLLALGATAPAVIELMLGAPTLIVATWFGRSRALSRVPRTLPELRNPDGWARVLVGHAELLVTRADEVRRIHRRIRRLEQDVEALRRSVATSPGRLDDLARHLEAARCCVEPLAALMTDGSVELHLFAERWRRGPNVASAWQAPIPVSVDGDAVELGLGRLLSYVTLAVNGSGLETPGGEVFLKLRELLREVLRLDGSLADECRDALHAADMLHCATSTAALRSLSIGPLTATLPRGALAAAVSVRRPRTAVVRSVVRASVREEFLRRAPRASTPRWRWIPHAASAAFRQGRHIGTPESSNGSADVG